MSPSIPEGEWLGGDSPGAGKMVCLSTVESRVGLWSDLI